MRKMKKIRNSFKYAIEGIWTSFKTERNMKIHIFIMILVIIAGIILKINKSEWIICIILFAIVFVFTKEVILVFVKAEESIINMGITPIRMYLSAFCIMNINILMCNYFQSIGREKVSVSISIIRGFLLNIILVLIMPVVIGGNSLWIVVPITEIITFFVICIYSNRKAKVNYKACNP